MYRKSLSAAAAIAVAIALLLSAQSGGRQPGSPGNPDAPPGVGVVRIERSNGTHTLSGLNADTFLAQVARDVQLAYKGHNHADVTPTFLAGYLASSYDDVLLLPGEVKYEWRKNIVTCELEKICVADNLLAVGDPTNPQDPVLVDLETTMVLK